MTERTTGLFEVVPIADTFAMGVEVEDLANDMRRLIFYAPHGTERHICAKLIVPAGCLITITETIVPHAQKVAEKVLTLVSSNHNNNNG